MGIGRSLAVVPLVAAMAPCWGCGIGPRHFPKLQHPAPLVRARSIGLGGHRPDAQALSALVGRLEDPDPVVRLAAHEELRRRTGRDFGFVPWAGADERAGAIARWRAWLGSAGAMASAARSTGLPPRPGNAPPVSPADSARPPIP